MRARQQRRRYLEDRRRVVVAQSMVRTWLAHRHKAAAVIQQAVRKFLLVKRQKRIREGIVKAQVLMTGLGHLSNFIPASERSTFGPCRH